jgi:glycerophosphoryl diester phosphodiesterase
MSVRNDAAVARPRVSWHRGGAEVAPYATLAAFAAAAARGAELVEVDVRRTGDGALVCVHDPHVPGLGQVAELNWSDASVQRAAKGRAFGFQELLDVLDEHDPGHLTDVHLDVKEAGLEIEAVDMVLGRSRRPVVTSGEHDVISAVRSRRPEVPALLTIGRDGRGLTGAELVRVRFGEMLPFRQIEQTGATGVAAHFLLAGRVLRQWCTRRGMQLLVWTVDSDDALARWLSRTDVDVVTTNRPLAALAMRDAIGRGATRATRRRGGMG